MDDDPGKNMTKVVFRLVSRVEWKSYIFWENMIDRENSD